MARTNWLYVMAMLISLVPFRAPVAVAEGSLIPGPSPSKGSNDIGIIFNTNDLVFGLQAYQAGIGGKIGWGNVFLRGMLDFTLNGSSQAFATEVGATGEYHFFPGPISPYVGAMVGGGYETQANVSSTLSFSLGAVAGVEVFIADFLSLFAEYTLEADFDNTTDLQTSQSTFDYLVDTKMGNNAQIGVVIYLMRSVAKE